MKTLKYFKKQFAVKHFISYFVLIGVILVIAVLSATGALSRSAYSTLTKIGYSMILAVSLNLVVGFLGELSLGHAGFMCVGAYIGCFIFNLLEPVTGSGILTLIIAMLSGGVSAAIFGFIIGVPALRLRGDYLAICTLAFGEIVRNVFKNLPFFGGAKGLNTGLFDRTTLLFVTLVTVLVVLAIVQNLIRSKHGRAITAIRDNEIAARAMGVNVTYYKLLVFVLSAFAAGLSGVLYGKAVGIIRQDNFSYNYSIEILVMVVLGGIGSMNGSLIAATIITAVTVFLQNPPPAIRDALNLGDDTLAIVKTIAYAVILILIIMYNNAPVFAGLREKLSIKKLFAKFKKKDPGNISADEAKWDRITTKIEMDEVLRVDVKKREGELTDPDKPERGAK